MVITGISGSINSLACVLGSHFGSVSLDRFFRLHIAYLPPSDPKERPTSEKRGDDEKTPLKIFLKSTPTAVVWDGMLKDAQMSPDAGKDTASDNEEINDDEWDGMDVVTDEGGASESDDEVAPAAVRPKRA